MAIRFLRRIVPERHPVRLAWHKAKALCAALLYGVPGRKLTVIGITGTDGKTTTVAMLHHILRSAGRTVGSASTACLQIGSERTENDTHLTSLSPFVLQRFLRRCVSAQCEYAIIEVSSHGLVQGRVDHCCFELAAITNIAPEHLDYHGTFDRYRADKGLLLKMLKGKGVKVLNQADESFAQYNKISSEETITYGAVESDFSLKDLEVSAHSSRAIVQAGAETLPLVLTVPGAFNMENALCAIACASALGIPLSLSCMSLSQFESVPGRLECIDEGQDFQVYVDFAVSAQAYEKTLLTLRGVVGEEGRVLVLCSACGNRMRESRPEVGRVASTYADVVVVCEDETYGEDPRIVLEEVWSGVQSDCAEAHKVPDRREAIELILRLARRGDAVVLCGMGPFSTMTTLAGRIPWDERAIVRDILRDKNQKNVIVATASDR